MRKNIRTKIEKKNKPPAHRTRNTGRESPSLAGRRRGLLVPRPRSSPQDPPTTASLVGTPSWQRRTRRRSDAPVAHELDGVEVLPAVHLAVAAEVNGEFQAQVRVASKGRRSPCHLLACSAERSTPMGQQRLLKGAAPPHTPAVKSNEPLARPWRSIAEGTRGNGSK